MYDEGLGDIYSGIQKTVAGLMVAKVGASLAQLFSVTSGVLIVDDATGAGVTDDGLLAVSLAGLTFSAKAALEGVVVAAKGIGQAINGAKKVINAKSNQKQSSVVSPSPLPPDDDNNDGKNKENKKPTSQNQLQKQVEKGQAPKEIDRVDKAHIDGQQPHVHFKDGTSLNQDGTVHDAHNSVPNPSNATKEWLQTNGWSTGE